VKNFLLVEMRCTADKCFSAVNLEFAATSHLVLAQVSTLDLLLIQMALIDHVCVFQFLVTLQF